jgi:hypothetical protein
VFSTSTDTFTSAGRDDGVAIGERRVIEAVTERVKELSPAAFRRDYSLRRERRRWLCRRPSVHEDQHRWFADGTGLFCRGDGLGGVGGARRRLYELDARVVYELVVIECNPVEFACLQLNGAYS